MNMKSYNQICDELEGMSNQHPAKSAQLDMISEYGEFNHHYCSGIMSILKDWNYDYNKDCIDENYEAPPLDETKIKSLAQKIHDRGDLQTLQMNFYVMLHFHAEDMPTKRKVQQLTWIFNNVGTWKN